MLDQMTKAQRAHYYGVRYEIRERHVPVWSNAPGKTNWVRLTDWRCGSQAEAETKFANMIREGAKRDEGGEYQLWKLTWKERSGTERPMLLKEGHCSR